MQIIFHGAGREVGRSCIELDNKFLFDAGLKITEHGTEYPTYLDINKIKAIFISHAHLDHTGALPLLNHKGLRCPIYTTRMSKLMTEVLLEDSFHIDLITHTHPAYNEANIFNVLQHFRDVEYNKKYAVDKVSNVDYAQFQYLDAGHIPGSASVLFEYKGRRILYTGDINWLTTQLLNGASYKLKNVDVMILESTYGDREHQDRQETEQRFISVIKEAIAKDGSVLLPSFAVGRAQELMLVLAKSNIGCPVYLDGMAKKVTDICVTNPNYVKNAPALRQAQKKLRYILNEGERRRTLKERCVIITTSGMVTGGPVMDYLKMMFFNPDNVLLLTGYQGDGTNGRLLLQEKCVYVDGKKVRWTGRIEQFDFSAHAGQEQLVAAVQQIKPKHLILNHGDELAIETLQSLVKGAVKYISAPQNDEIIEI